MDFLRSFRLILGAACIALISVAPVEASDSYIDSICTAASVMKQGDYDKAVQEINVALTKRSGDPLAHLALGIVFLNTRQLDQAFRQFNKVNDLSKGNPLALYGFGLYYLASGKKDSALSYFKRAGADGGYDTAPTIAYLDALAGRYFDGKSINPLLQQITAQGHFNRGQYQQAEEILKSMTKNWKGFNEEPGAVTTFDPAKPVALAGKGLSKPYKTPNQAEPKLKKVGGKVTLRAELAQTQGIAYVLFYVDDALIGMVNHSPYECIWDTTRFANSPHSVKIEGHDAAGVVISSKSLRVAVSNSGPTSTAAVDDGEAKRAEGMLWDCLRLQPSRRLTYYLLGKCERAQKDNRAATASLERAVGIDPSFRDARSLLIQWYSPIRKYQEIHRAPTQQKLAAITFDDGPNPGTGRILDVLAQKGVKATFFVVGGMAEMNPDMVKRMAAEGHELENHTYSHRNLHYLPDVETEKELVRTAAIVRELTGQSTTYFRPPGGNKNGYLNRSAGKFGFSSVFWTINCVKNEGTRPENIVRQVTSGIKPGSIILMHNLEEVTLTALPKVIDGLRAKGYKLVTLSEMMAAK